MSLLCNISLGHRLLSIQAVSRDKIDPKVIDGHIVPNVALFTRPAIKGRPVQTLAFSDNLKVTVSFTNESLPLPEQSGSKGTTNARHLFMTVDDRKCLRAVYVQSNTLVGDFHHPRGVVVAQVVKGNIPVRNGVVHLIDKPLIVIDIDIVNFLKVKTPLLASFCPRRLRFDPDR